MQSEIEKLKILFENEIWFLIDGTIEGARREFWLSKIKEHAELQIMYKEYSNIIDNYNDEEFDISDEKLVQILQKTKSKSFTNSGILEKLSKIFSSKNEDNQLKVLVGGALAAIAIIFLLISPNKTSKNIVDDSLLNWETEEISNTTNNFSQNISGGKNENAKEYIMQQISNDEWKSSVFTIASKIEELEKELNNSSL